MAGMKQSPNADAADLPALSSGVQSPVKPAFAPDISPQQATKNLATQGKFRGGAMAFHNPQAMAVGTHNYSSGMAGAHIMHPPRTV